MIRERDAVGALLVLAAAVLWGTVGPAQVFAGSAADPGTLGAVRLLVGGAVLSVLAVRGVPWRALASAGTWPWVVTAAISTAAYQVTFLHAVQLTGAALGTTVALGCAPFATGIFSWWWTGRRPGRQWLLGTLAAVAGCALILAPSGAVRLDPMGVALAVVSGCCYGAYTVAAKRFLDTGLPSQVTIAVTLALGGILLLPLIAWHPQHLLAANTLALVAWIGVVGTAGAYLLFGRGLSATTAATAGTLSLAEPLTAALLGVLVLGEHLSAPALAGCVMLFAGLVSVSIPRRAARGRRRGVEVAVV